MANEENMTQQDVTGSDESYGKKYRFSVWMPNTEHRLSNILADSVEEAKQLFMTYHVKDYPMHMVTSLQWQMLEKFEIIEPKSKLSSIIETVKQQQISELSPGLKHDNGKIPYHLLSFYALESISEVLKFGAQKYSERNWEKGILYSRVFRACIGHLFDWWQNKGPDPETGMSHLWHAGCCIMFLIHYEKYNTKFDDRPKYKEKEKDQA